MEPGKRLIKMTYLNTSKPGILSVILACSLSYASAGPEGVSGIELMPSDVY